MFNKLKAFLAIGLLVALSACTVVETGNVGVERSFGKYTPAPLPQGVYMTILDSVDEYTTKEVSFPLADLKPKSKDNLTLQDLDIDVYFKTTPAKIPELVVKYQGDAVRHGDIVEGGTNVMVVGYNRVLRAAREATYKAAAQFTATTMHTQREEISEAIRKELQKELDASDPGTFSITSVNVRNLMTDKAIEAAIQNQVRLDQSIIAKQKEVVLAQAEAERLAVQAQGEADANQILGESLTDRVMQLRMAELQRDTIVQSAKAGSVIYSGIDPLITTR